VVTHTIRVFIKVQKGEIILKNCNIKKWSIFAVALASILVSTIVVFADDGKVYSGAECKFTEPGSYSGQETSYIKLKNTSGGTRTFGCPFIKDNAGDYAYAYIIATATMDEDTCKLCAREDDTSWGYWFHDSVTSVATGVNKTSWWDGAAMGTGSAYDSLQLTCVLPDDGIVYSYYMSED